MGSAVLAASMVVAILSLALAVSAVVAGGGVESPQEAHVSEGGDFASECIPAGASFTGISSSSSSDVVEVRWFPQDGGNGWGEEPVFEEDPVVPCYVVLGGSLGEEQPHPLSWPNPYLPISRSRWLTIMRVLLSVPNPGYETLLDATLKLFIPGRRRLHRDLVRIHRRSTGGLRGLVHFMRGREDNRAVAEIWWSGEEDEVKVAPTRQWSDPGILDKFERARFYRFRWEQATSLRMIRWAFGGRTEDKYATLIIRLPPEEYDDLQLPLHGKYLTELQWRNYIQQYDINDHYTNWQGSI